MIEDKGRLAGKLYRFDLLEVSDISVDPRVQQPLVESRVKKILSKGYDPAAAGTIVVSRREKNGRVTLVVIDGQHRAEAARRSGFPYLEAQVWHNLTLADEAWLFYTLNAKDNPPALAVFLTKLIDNDPVMMQIADTVSQYGWHISGAKNQDGEFAAVGTAERIFRGKGIFGSEPMAAGEGRLFDGVMRASTKAWGVAKAASDGHILEGLAVLLLRYPGLDEGKLVHALGRMTPEQFRAEAKSIQKSMGVKPALAYGYAAHREYNKRTRTKLPAFAL